MPRRAVPGLVDRGEQLGGVATLDSPPEVRRCRAAADELDVHVRLARRGRTGAGGRSGRRRRGEDRPRARRRRRAAPGARALARDSRRVALALPELGGVDLHEPDAHTAPEVERVTVADARDRRCVARTWLSELPHSREQRRRRSARACAPRAFSGQTGGSCRPGRFAFSLRSDVPRPEDQTAGDDHDRGPEPDPEPDGVEDQDEQGRRGAGRRSRRRRASRHSSRAGVYERRGTRCKRR